MDINYIKKKKLEDKNRLRSKLREDFEKCLIDHFKSLKLMVVSGLSIIRLTFPVIEKFKDLGMTYNDMIFVLKKLYKVENINENSLGLRFRRYLDFKKYGSCNEHKKE